MRVSPIAVPPQQVPREPRHPEQGNAPQYRQRFSSDCYAPRWVAWVFRHTVTSWLRIVAADSECQPGSRIQNTGTTRMQKPSVCSSRQSSQYGGRTAGEAARCLTVAAMIVARRAPYTVFYNGSWRRAFGEVTVASVLQWIMIFGSGSPLFYNG